MSRCEVTQNGGGLTVIRPVDQGLAGLYMSLAPLRAGGILINQAVEHLHRAID